MKEEIPKIAFLKKSKAEIEFEIFTIQSLFSRQNKIDHPLDQPHRVAFYNIIYITKGTGVHSIDFHSYPYTEGSLIFISKDQVHSFDMESDIDGFVILFTDEFLSKNLFHSDILSFNRLYNYHLHEPIIYPEQACGEVFKNIVNEMCREYLLSNDFAKEEILRLLLKLLLLRAERIKRTMIPKEKNTEWFRTFNEFKHLLEKHYTATRNAKVYASLMSISYKHLNEVCKSIAGITAKAFLDQFIILETKRRLAISNASVKELTYALGFDEPTNFVKFFKKHTGQSPSQFKKKITQ
jgi:AraC family transcriptional regulator, transcriptional activator of pobA